MLETSSFLGGKVVAQEVAKVRRVGHESSPSSRSARRASALRVRVLTVPSGTSRNCAISLWESPPQYEGAMHAPGRPARLCALRRSRILRCFVDRLCRWLAESAPSVDDGVSRDGVE